MSRTTIWRRFSPFLSCVPTPMEINNLFLVSFTNPNWVLGIDGKWLKRQGVILVCRDVTNGVNLFWSWNESESHEAVQRTLFHLRVLVKDNLPAGTVSDWKGAMVSAVNQYFPHAPHQRCLSHVLREAKRLLPLKSPYAATKELRRIAEGIFLISVVENLSMWRSKVEQWLNKYGYLLKEKTRGVNTKRKWWYTHGNLRRAIRLLTLNQENSFAYLQYPFLPKTNNSIEGVNSFLKQKLGDHRGIKTPEQTSFLFWLLVLSRIKTREDLKRLWDMVLKKKIIV